MVHILSLIETSMYVRAADFTTSIKCDKRAPLAARPLEGQSDPQDPEYPPKERVERKPWREY